MGRLNIEGWLINKASEILSATSSRRHEATLGSTIEAMESVSLLSARIRDEVGLEPGLGEWID